MDMRQTLNGPSVPMSTKKYPIVRSLAATDIPISVNKIPPSRFPPASLEPKVNIPYESNGGPPRKIEIERRRRLYQSLDISELLKDEGIDLSLPESQRTSADSFEHFLPLDAFDNTEFEVRAPESWIELGRAENGDIVGVPAKGLRLRHDKSGVWRGCVVKGYNPTKQVYRVEWLDLEDPKSEPNGDAWLPRLQVLFLAEDPRNFAKRIANAYITRKEVERILRYNLYIDCMPSDDITEPNSEQMQHVLDLALSTVSLRHNALDTSSLLTEIKTDFSRTMNKIVFNVSMLDPAQNALFESLDLPRRVVETPEEIVPRLGVVETPQHDFTEQFSNLSFHSLLTKKEVIDALDCVRKECLGLSGSHLFNCAGGKSLRVEEFESGQHASILQYSQSLSDHWTQSVKTHVINKLSDVGKGWYNLKETKKEVYEFSKLKKFLKMVNFMMQDTLRFNTERNLNEFCDHVMSSCKSDVRIHSTNNVTCTVNGIEYRKPPLFAIELVPDTSAQATEEYTFRYSVSLDTLKASPLAQFDKGLVSMQDIVQVERLVMTRLFWPHKPVLQTVRPAEEWVGVLRDELEAALSFATTPLQEYLSQYDGYLDFLRLDINKFMEDLSKEQSKAFDLEFCRSLVAEHQQSALNVIEDVPSKVSIGLASVDCSSVGEMLATKHRKIADLVLNLISEINVEMATEVCESFQTINRELSRFPNNIEQLCEIKSYLSSVPGQVQQLQSQIDRVMNNMECMYSFKMQLPRDQFDLRWKVFGWPKNVHDQMADVSLLLAKEERRYLSEMKDEQAQFEEHLNSLHSEVRSFHQFTDLSKVQTIAGHVRNLKKQINDAIEKSRLFNTREGLFDEGMTEYDRIAQINKEFEPYAVLWETTDNWLVWHDSWLKDPFLELDAETMERSMGTLWKNIFRSSKTFEKMGIKGCLDIAAKIKEEIDGFRPHIPLVISLRNPGMQSRHWQELSKHLGFNLEPDENFTLNRVFELKLQDHIEVIQKVGEKAGKEFQIEVALNKMNEEWENVMLEIMSYRETGTFVLKGVDELQALLDEHVTMSQAMSFSAFKKPFEERIEEWSSTLNIVSETLDEWIQVQRNWLYLQPIFDSPDIQKQLPTEHKRFSTVDKNWRNTLASAKAHPKAIKFCNNAKLLEKFQESSKFLDLVQKGLSDYLETKRAAFARFYFLSNDELLEILAQTKDPRAVQPHLKKCFEGIRNVEFNDEMEIISMVSAEKEMVQFVDPVDPKSKNVEVWMNELEDGMRSAVKHVAFESIMDYIAKDRQRTDWVQRWPGQCVLSGSQLHWTREIEAKLRAKGHDGLIECLDMQLAQLQDMVHLVRGKLDKLARITMGALTVIDVHARDVTKRLIQEKVSTVRDFDWISQMRYYWETNDDYDLSTANEEDGAQFVTMVSSKRPYGYEYIGNTFRLVITPLTDKCYLTLMGALQMNLGGAPAGPAGTGKTETTKDLAKALAKQCVVFNCSDGLDYLAMGKFFKGLASCGAWACFDEFNRIDVEVLSVVAQQIITLQNGVNQGLTRIWFEDAEIALNSQFAVFITMNPGYAGRTELPDNLKALFRPVAMMVPDYALIGEIMLFSFGFDKALSCAKKMAATFRLCSEQLSSQDHYDYGMRAVKTVITAAGNLKSQDPDMDEEVLLLRALSDVNLPKFLEQDLPLYEGILSDLFPGVNRPRIDYGELLSCLNICTEQHGLQPVSPFITKCIQLYETIVVRHGLMVVGPTGGGKSAIIKVLADALGMLKAKGIEGPRYEAIKTRIMNPKSITMGQLYGEFDANTHEWNDGILALNIRECARMTTSDLKWIIFDGPVDALWIENMNTVLDDNKKLCLVSGEIIALSDEMSIIFEPEDLAVASPATVSRCGMVYMEPHALTLDPLIQSWLERLPNTLSSSHHRILMQLFDTYVLPTLGFLRKHLREPVPTVDNNLLCSLMNIMDCYLSPYYIVEGRDPPTQEEVDKLLEQLEPLFLFSLFWSCAATVDNMGRDRFDSFLRNEMRANGVKLLPPDDGLVYDFKFDMETIQWVKWMDTVEPYQYDRKLSFSELIIPTKDTVRYKYLLDLLIRHNKYVLMTGPTGTGKTANINQQLQFGMEEKYVPLQLTFSAQTSANQTQDIIDEKCEKRRKGVFGPPAGKKYMLFVDDLNMPQREEYFAQPPIELLRQWCDYGGWYDRKTLQFMKIVDVVLVGAMGPPGGGRNPITGRILRHFNTITYTEMDDESKSMIFRTILGNFLRDGFNEDLLDVVQSMVSATVDVYSTVVTDLLPTPAKPHYTFNLRDMAKVFQGLLMANKRKVDKQGDLIRMWVHENKRVFQDRLINEQDRKWFDELLATTMKDRFKVEWDDIVTQDRLLFGDYLVPGADPRVYEEVSQIDTLVPLIEEYLADYNAESKTPMKLVMFLDAIEHVSRISRVIRQPQGNALLLGVGGSGRQSLTRLATFMADCKLSQVEITKGYGPNEWREDIKNVLLSAGLDDNAVVFLFNDTQIVFEGMLEDVNGILNGGDVPNLYGPDDMDRIITTCRIDCQRKRIPPTKINIFAQYLLRVRRNIHVVICMSPMSNAFRDRLRMFPSLVNCCTIDWFSEWPEEALKSVAHAALSEDDLKLDQHLDAVVEFFKIVHQSVAEASNEYYDVLRRHNYVTPTSYLELLNTFKTILGLKRNEVGSLRDRLQIGLDKLETTATKVEKLQVELREKEPMLIQKREEVEQMLKTIQKDKAEANETKKVVEKEEAEAEIKANETRAIADDAQRDLDEAMPALHLAVACLEKLKKSDIDEVRAMKNPPGGVKLTMEACCIMFQVKPVMKADPDNLGKKIKDYWEAAQKQLLVNANKLKEDLKNYDKDNIPEKTIELIEPYIARPDFVPAIIEKASKACTAICMWARAMHKYHHVAKAVEPKKQKLREAQESLDKTMAALNDAKGRLKAVQDKIGELEEQYSKAVGEKERLEADVEQCRARLERAEKLIGGLGGEKHRWEKSVAQLTIDFVNVAGDALVSSSTIAYLGAFTMEFRETLVKKWQGVLKQLDLPHTDGCDLRMTLADPVQVRAWNIAGLPTDFSSVENGIIMDKARRWPLLIDPQGQANRYIKNMGREAAENGMDVIRLTEKNFLRSLENGVRFGKWVLLENILESLDAALEPILLQQKFKQGGSDMIRLGDSTIPYNDSFRFFMTTKLPNPHYPPEVAVKVTLLNFTITPSGLEDQLLGQFIVCELPELEEKKNSLVVSNARMKKELKDIEDRILLLLSKSKGDILDDEELIETLASSKKTSQEIQVKVKETEETEQEIDATREKYRPVAFRASTLYFCISNLATIDPMYQYSLPWFGGLFKKAIEQSEPANEIEKRIENLNDYFTYMIYVNVCRSLFERHKLLFSFLMCIKVLQGQEMIDALEWRFLISGQSPSPKTQEKPEEDWIDERMWTELQMVAGLSAFGDILDNFTNNIDEWKHYFDSSDTHKQPIPGGLEDRMNKMQRLCILRCVRPDKMMESIQDFVVHYLGKKFVEPPPFDLQACFQDSFSTTPLIFVLSTGSDPTKAFYDFAESCGFSKKVQGISLGQGQGKIAARLIEEAVSKGSWVLLQNCHLASSWMSELERICEEMTPDKVHKDFRLWLTSMPSKAFPVSVLQNGVKMTNEPPKGLRQNIKNFYYSLNDDILKSTSKPTAFRKLLFGLSFFHAIVQERRKYGPLGWNVPYEFNDTDLEISKRQLELFLDEYEQVPYTVLNFLTSYINYGGRVTDAIDLRTIDIILKKYFCSDVMTDDYKFSESGLYYSLAVSDEGPHGEYMSYIDSLPINPDPEVFGMHPNADITCAMTETTDTFDTILSLQPRTAAGAGKSREELIGEVAQSIENRLPPIFDEEAIKMQYPVMYEESMNTVLVQECVRYNKLLKEMKSTLSDVQKALKGLVVMSSELEAMADSLNNQWVPKMWEAKSYPSLKPLGAWVQELLERLQFIQGWIDDGTPASYWISGFFFPQAFLTGTLQNFARKYVLPIDTLSYSFHILETTYEEIDAKPDDGCYIRGLFLEGARYDPETKALNDSIPKQLYTSLPVLHLLPVANREPPKVGVYRCPVYKILSRCGALSTTGHSTNFILFVELPQKDGDITNLTGEADCDKWIKAGVAAFCSLRY
eukprot:TRINITY_DN2137_c0_g4_i1.p1 TRINITY_DN2137_c0_g4~~TRINITY_DN2137_c0_g4_i1.p1  ORF type:complete len:4119 (-),score=1448.16 TRINITY_DN2137_c0_g4_i1:93-12449(-)